MKTSSELIKAIKKPGKVFVTMLTKDDVVRGSVENYEKFKPMILKAENEFIIEINQKANKGSIRYVA